MIEQQNSGNHTELQVLYFDVSSLLLCTDYLDRHPHMRFITEVDNYFAMNHASFLEQVVLDPKGIELLNAFCMKSNIILYPLGTLFPRELLIEQGIKRECLAPNKSLALRLNDSNPIRRMLAHAYRMNADWRVVGDLCLYDMQLSSYASRYMKTDSASGITENLIREIANSFHNEL
ncbi:TPA: hypothetical protein ACMD0U_000258 [Vibrio parahaemolyticus]|uniref:hypothetical protein n=1 Tax=Vibrio parahaemolyticus TaxID=670 RepID=UPI00193EA162|nr:hypothetical protein [Vibrio parahaemolyticus]MBM5070125.1 hypothetical protein [Vibrio parahaemolyticus]MBO0234818.1 hypothetical protein [Vibrio parahaemolyticus]MDG2623150.1 hypothetical protein [Vibrio parahaemolyticus]